MYVEFFLQIFVTPNSYKTKALFSIEKYYLVDIMGRRQTMMEKYKQQMKAYRKKRMIQDSTPFLPLSGNVYVMDSLDPTKKLKVEVLKTRTKQHREIIDSLACPVCGNPMEWDSRWEGFICVKHGKKAIYELVEGD
jgi:tRNA(Ile2) C34 agmatinyltransferase TiaS